jgi:hypothetical protein
MLIGALSAAVVAEGLLIMQQFMLARDGPPGSTEDG